MLANDFDVALGCDSDIKVSRILPASAVRAAEVLGKRTASCRPRRWSAHIASVHEKGLKLSKPSHQHGLWVWHPEQNVPRFKRSTWRILDG